MAKEVVGSLDGRSLAVAIVVARFNEFISERLLAGAQDGLSRHGVNLDDVDIVRVPGSFEVPLAARWLAESGRYQAVVCLGAVIRGETPHFDQIASVASSGVSRVALDTGVPVIFGILTTNTVPEAIDRAGAKAGNRGYDAAVAAIEMANLRRQLAARPD